MRLSVLSVFALSLALMAGELQAQSVLVFDNLSPAGNNLAPAAGGQRALIGETFDTSNPPNGASSILVNSVSLRTIAFGATGGTSYDDVAVEVSLFSGVIDGAFGIPTSPPTDPVLLGSQTFDLGTLTTPTDGGNLVVVRDFDFDNLINIGDGSAIGISFGFSDSSGGAAAGNITGLLRNLPSGSLAATQVANRAAIGFSADEYFLDATGDGALNLDDGNFRFNSDANLAFSVSAVSAVPEPSSIAVLGLLGLGFVTRRRR